MEPITGGSAEHLERHVADLAAALEAKDRGTSDHLLRVSRLAEGIAEALGLTGTALHEVRLAAVLHDLGKLWIHDRVLKKQAPLDAEEWEHMKQHPLLGWRMLSGVPELARVTEGLLLHHERIDGLGYPFGLSGDRIPLLARIIAVADSYDAMTSDRPYRPALPPAAALAELRRCRGTQFCEKVVDAFVAVPTLGRMHVGEAP